MSISQSIKDFPVIRSIYNIVNYNATTGNLEGNGGAISGIASYTWAQFTNLTAGELTALAGLAVHINDVHCNAAGIGGCYFVRDASPAGWGQISGPLYYTNVSDFPAAATWTDLRCHSTATDLDYKSNGTIYEIDTGKGIIARGSPRVRVISPNAAITWTAADNGSGKVRLTSSGANGLSTAICVTAGQTYLYVTTTQNGWTARSLHLIASIGTGGANNVDLDTTWDSHGVPLFALAGTEFILKSVVIPPLTTEGFIEVDAAWGSSSGSGAKTPNIRFGATDSGITGTLYCGNTAHAASNLSMIPRTTVIQNAGSVSSQTGLVSAAGVAAGSVISATAIPISSIDTSVATELNITAMMASANDPIWLNRYVVSVGS